ncbi:hypothetical protein [Bacillus mojavensis]|uniref:hypothetical protein n=1 Tax=Bacillus mojavensis TaxID=72360 RepID=UPI00227E2505|nr:hypothetical protein [Bacillus mojavensis]MCY9190433.1 hypothetical protein [Bacillus mojavensis]
MRKYENKAREWKVYIIIFSFFIICVAAIGFFEQRFLLNQLAWRVFDALISVVLFANVLFFWRKRKSIAYISGILAVVNVILLISLLFLT